MYNKKQFYSLAVILMFLFSFGLLAQTTMDIEAENYTYAEDDTTWVVHDDVTASNGKFLAMENHTFKSGPAVGWKIDLTSSTDTIYYVWYYARRPLDSFAGYHRFYLNIDGDTTTAGSSWPFQYFNNTQFQEEAADSLYEWRWYQNHSGGGKHDSISIQPGQHVVYLRQRDNSGFELDKIKITNDLTWKPEVTYEWEAEDSNWTIGAPMEVMAEAGASGGWVVGTQAGSGTISNVDILNGNLDVGIRDGRVANDDCYLWMLVNLPSEASNSYWIGMGDEGIIPPSWEGAVTNGYEWRQLTDETGAVKPLHLVTNKFNKFHTVRIKQQEEGTKIDKYLLTNNPDFVPGGATPSGGLVAHWDFDTFEEVNGDMVFTDTENGHKAMAVDSVQLVDGGFNKALSLSQEGPASQRLEVMDKLNLVDTGIKGEMTVAAWTRTTIPAGMGINQTLFSKMTMWTAPGGDQADSVRWKLGIHKSGKYVTSGVTATGTFSPGSLGSPSAPAEEWAHIAFVLVPDSAKLYVNGVLLATAPYLPGPNVNAPIMLGNVKELQPDGSYKYGAFFGMLDDFRLYNKALSSDEIAALAQGTPVGVEDSETKSIMVDRYDLGQNYPNPFNPTTVINYAIPTTSRVSLSVYNVLGQKVANLVNEIKSQGSYSINFNASNLSSGIYYYTIKAGNFVSTKKMILLK